MNKAEILKRLAILEHIRRKCVLYAVLKTGERKQYDISDCDFLDLANDKNVVSFEGERGKENGKLIDLLNGLKEEIENET